MGSRGVGDARNLGVVRVRRLAQPSRLFVDPLGERVPLGENRLQLGLEVLLLGSDGVHCRLGGRLASRAAWKGIEAGADPELGLEHAAVLFGERVGDRARGDEAELDENRTERTPGPLLLGECKDQLIGGHEPLFDHELA